MQLVDSHCHIDFEHFDIDRDQILHHCQQLGVEHIIVPGVMANSWDKLINICQQSTMLHPALGLHPMFMAHHKTEHLFQLQTFATDHPVIAIGEIGLDFYVQNHDKEAQISLFTQQLNIAQKLELPVILHVRKAHDEVINILKQFSIKGGIIHAFNGSLQQAENYQKLGFLFGVGGAITYPKSTRLKSLFQTLSLRSLVLETDAPDMPLFNMPQQHNTPENIPTILQALSQLRSESTDTIASITTRNCQHLFNLNSG